MSFTLYTSKQYAASLNTLAKNQKQADELIHQLACNAIYHSVKDGQVTPANQLLAKLGRSSRKNDLISWIIRYGNFKWNATEKTLEHCAKHKHEELAAHVQAEAAFNSPFYDEVVERRPIESVDVLALIKSSVNKVKKEMKEAAESGRSLEVKHAEALTDLENILNRFNTTAA
jgi:hypothetical protein